MILKKNKWIVSYDKPYNDEEIISILHKNIGIEDYVSFLGLGFKDFNDPFLFKNMDIIVKKIKMSIRNNEKILIFGDYDVDGITATAILYRTLKDKGADVSYMIPNRFASGYGLSREACEEIILNKINLVITVDNGITCVDEINFLQENGITVIVTDHHEMADSLPQTPYILHSYLLDDYPFKDLCGAGVSFKLCEAIDKEFARGFVDLCALGTIADMMSVHEENKAIINEGLKLINNTKVLGLKRLLDSMGLIVKNISDISFNIAPKLNSLGRIKDATIAVRLLVTDSETEIQACLKELYDTDELRKQLTIQNTDLAYKMINENDKVNLIYSPNFFEGILGIIAQKVMRKTNKLTGIFNIDSDNNAKGSFRSADGINILDLLSKHKDLLTKFGGHENACGVNMPTSNIKELKECLEKEEELLQGKEQELNVEVSLNHSLLNLEFVNELIKYDMADKLFLLEGLEVCQTYLMADKHTKVRCRLSNGYFVNIIMFNDRNISFNLSPKDIINCVVELKINTYNGYDSIQAIVRDYEVNDLQVIDLRKDYEAFGKLQEFMVPNSLILDSKISSIADLSLILEKETPSIIYLVPFEKISNVNKLGDLNFLRSIVLLLSKTPFVSEILLSKQLCLDKQLLDQALEILEELELVSRENGFVKYTLKHVDPEESDTFRNYRNLYELYELLDLNINEIKNTCLSMIK